MAEEEAAADGCAGYERAGIACDYTDHAGVKARHDATGPELAVEEDEFWGGTYTDC